MNWDTFENRLGRFRTILLEQGLDAFLVAVAENRYYLSGFRAEDLHVTESSGYLLISGTNQFLLTDFRYEEQARREAFGYEIVIYKEGFSQVLPELFSMMGIERLGVEAHYLTFQKYQEIRKALEETRPQAELAPTEGLVEELRVVKEPAEIDKIRASLAVTEKVLERVWGQMHVGRTEAEVAWEIEKQIREEGAEAVSFPPIVAAGPNGALPHAVPGKRKIAPGDAVVLDLGSKVDLYCSDMTRTWIAEAADKKIWEIYRIVREAQLAAQDAIHAGADTAAVDAVARGLIEKAGYGDYFGHGLGHGVGLAVHERPGLRKQKGTTLAEDMIVTVEPGIYLPGLGGVRLENMVRVTGSGCEVLNRQDLFYL